MAEAAATMEKLCWWDNQSVPLGVYISVPFCKTKCSYCNFASDVFSRVVFERYVDRVCADVANACKVAEEMGGRFEREVDSIYLGGGTPTLLDSVQLKRVFEAVREQFSVQEDAEVTVECAPGTLAHAVIETLLRCGVNRVSLGVQSFIDAEAAGVGRLHKRSTVLEEIARLRSAGIADINIDLIAGLPHQTHASWQESLSETIATGAPHVSIYMLEVDEDSRLGREVMAGGTRYHAHFVPDEDATADFYLAACDRLQAAGIAQYEISNFAKPGAESRHNLKYWTRQPYLGLGVDAHSMLLSASGDWGERSVAISNLAESVTKREGHDFSRAANALPAEPALATGDVQVVDNVEAVRFCNADTLEKYVAGSPLERTAVSSADALEECFFLGLRLNHGVDLRQIAAAFGDESIRSVRPAIAELVAEGLLVQDGDFIRLTQRGRLLSNEVFQRFIVEHEVAS